MLKDLGEVRAVTVSADSAAALTIADRKGSGKLKHLNIGLLWIQSKERKEDLAFEKVLGTENPADMMTNILETPKVKKFSEMLQQEFREGRAQEGLKVQKTGSRDAKVVVA